MSTISVNPKDYLFIDKEYIEKLPIEQRKELIEYDYLKEIENFKKYYDGGKKNISINYKDFYEIYISILKEIKDLLNNISNMNKIEVMAIITELIWSGMLSKNERFVYSESFKVREEISALYGANVIYGYACCRNISGLVNDILNECNIDSYLVGVRNNKLNNGVFEVKSTRRDDMGNVWNNFSSRIKNSKSSFEMNHASVLFPYEGKFYIYDPTMIRFFKMKHYMGSEILGNGNVVMQPSTLSIFDGYSYEEIVNLVKRIKNSKGTTLDRDILSAFYHGVEEYDNNKSLVLELHKRIKPELKELDEFRKNVLLKR